MLDQVICFPKVLINSGTCDKIIIFLIIYIRLDTMILFQEKKNKKIKQILDKTNWTTQHLNLWASGPLIGGSTRLLMHLITH